jgi:hypothetical protein
MQKGTCIILLLMLLIALRLALQRRTTPLNLSVLGSYEQREDFIIEKETKLTLNIYRACFAIGNTL